MNTLSEYTRNLVEAVASEGAQPIYARAGEGGELDAIRLPTGGAIAWRAPESVDPTDSTSEVHKAALAIRTVTSAAARVAAIQRDDRLSDAAKADDVAKVWAEAAAKADKLASEVEAEAERFAAHERATLAPPPVTDPVHQMADMEARQWLASVPAADLPELVNKMQAGELPELLAAAMRSPVPLPGGIALALPAAWRAHLTRTRPDDLRALDARRERLTWLLEVTRQAAGAIQRPQTMGPVVRRVA